MVWPQFSTKIFGVHFGKSVLHNPNWDKINHSLTKKNQCFEQSTTLFGMREEEFQTKSSYQNFGI